MSNYLAIATVTAALQTKLIKAAEVIDEAVVTTSRPNGNDGAVTPTINIFLYHVIPNAAYRNCDLPTRRSDGHLAQRPQAALTLHYLLSFLGDDRRLEPQRLLGAAVRQLHAQPSITVKEIDDTINNSQYETILGASNLGNQLDFIRFTPLGYSLEELSKLWSVFFQSTYVLSVAYQASTVLIETDDAPFQALPVQTRNLRVLPFSYPVIDRVIALDDDKAPIFIDTVLSILGKQLRGEITSVLVGGREVAPLSVDQGRITFKLPKGSRPGVLGVQVLHKIHLRPEPAVPHRAFESNVASFVLRPRIDPPIVPTDADPESGSPPGLQVAVDNDLSIGRSQRVVLTLNSVGGSGAYSVLAKPRNDDTNACEFPILNIPPGRYFVRLLIDGADSPLDLDPTSENFGPTEILP